MGEEDLEVTPEALLEAVLLAVLVLLAVRVAVVVLVGAAAPPAIRCLAAAEAPRAEWSGSTIYASAWGGGAPAGYDTPTAAPTRGERP